MHRLVLDKRDTQVAVLDRRTKNQSVQEVLRDAIPLKARLARDLVKHRARRQAERAEPRVRVQKPVVRRRPSAPADAGDQWDRLRAQMKRETPVRQGIMPKPKETHQPALFTM